MAGSPLDQPYRGGFVGSEHRFALTVYFEDTDTAGVVYYAKHRSSGCGGHKSQFSPDLTFGVLAYGLFLPEHWEARPSVG